jgi:hypothetical protein
VKNNQSSSFINFNPSRDLDSREIVLEYFNAYVESKEMQSAISSVKSRSFDVSVLSSDDDLTMLTKRSSLITSRLLLAHDPTLSKKHTIWEDSESDNENVWDTTRDIRCPDIQRLADWLLDCAPLLRSGQVVYLPAMVESVYNANHQDYDFEDVPVGPRSPVAFDVFLRDGKAATLVGDSRLASRMFIPLMHLDLPSIEGTSMRDFADIAVDSSGSQASTRDFFRRRLLELLECETSKDLEASAMKLSVEISEGVREVKADLRRISRQRAVQTVGGILATTVASLVALDAGVFREILPIIGATGGAWGFAAAAMQRREEKMLIGDRPFYFFWLLEKRAKAS